MDLTISMTGNAVKFLQDVGEASEKASVKAANATAFDARLAMKQSALATQGEGIEGVTITFATPAKPYAQILSSNWDQGNFSGMRLNVDGGEQFRKAMLSGEMPGGDMVMLTGRFVGNKKLDKKGGGKAAQSNARATVATQHGFVGIMKGINAKSKNQMGIFMRIGAERKIRIMYRLKTLRQADALQVMGYDVAYKNFGKNFDRKLNGLLSRLSGSEWGK